MPRDTPEIGGAPAPRQKRAIPASTPIHVTPASAPTQTRASARKRAKGYTTSLMLTPASDILRTGESPRKRAIQTPTSFADTSASDPILSASQGDDEARESPASNVSAPHVAAITKQLASAQRRRKFCLKQKSRADRSIEALIASVMGYRIDLSEKEGKAIFARAKAHRLAVEKGGEDQVWFGIPGSNVLSAVQPLILTSASGREMWDRLLDETETEMVRLAKLLPAYQWTKTVSGFGEKGLAIIYAEGGANNPIETYRSVAGLWRRMGLAVINGERQQKKTDKELAAAHGYSPTRRSEMWNLADSMFRAQWNGARLQCTCSDMPQKFKLDDADQPVCEACGSTGGIIQPAHADGPYGEVYGRRKSHTFPRIVATADLSDKDRNKWTPGRCNRDAKRVMFKAVLRDLWRVTHGLPPRGSVPV